jgi:hypothetical protein
MNENEMKRPVEWADRINRRWIVHHGLGQRAEDWMAHLAKTDAKRLKKACMAARAMIRCWAQVGDPKPWFYSGLFSTATAEEAKHFLAGHRLTTATVPAMAEDDEVKDWVASLCTETRELLHRLRSALRSIRESAQAGKRP